MAPQAGSTHRGSVPCGTRSRQSEIIHKYREAIWRVYELPIAGIARRSASGPTSAREDWRSAVKHADWSVRPVRLARSFPTVVHGLGRSRLGAPD